MATRKDKKGASSKSRGTGAKRNAALKAKKTSSKKKKTVSAARRPAGLAKTNKTITAAFSTQVDRVPLNQNQCRVWRRGEFSQRVRDAVADWAGRAVSGTDRLGNLVPTWDEGEQGKLVQQVNSHKVFAPPFPDRQMLEPTQLLSASTTVTQWEEVVWRHQFPLTECFAFPV